MSQIFWESPEYYKYWDLESWGEKCFKIIKNKMLNGKIEEKYELNTKLFLKIIQKLCVVENIFMKLWKKSWNKKRELFKINFERKRN